MPDSLTRLDLGSNRLRKFEGLSTLTNLKELWLGRNKITQISGIENLTSLRILDVQSNRLLNLTYGPDDPKARSEDMKASCEDKKNAEQNAEQNAEHSETTESLARTTMWRDRLDNNTNAEEQINSLANNINLEELYRP